MLRRFPPLLALVIVVALLLVVGAVVSRDRAEAPTLDQTLALGVSSSATVSPAPEGEPAAAAVEAMSVTVGLGETATISGRVPDEATRTAVLEAVSGALAGADVVDQLTASDSVVPEGAQATLTGSLDTVETVDALVAALRTLGFEVFNQLTVGGQVANVAAVLDTDARLGRFRELVGAAGLQDVLTGAGPVSLFAPTDEALAGLSPAVSELLEDPERLAEFVLGHLVDSEVFAADLAVPQELTLATGDAVVLAGDGTIGGAGVVEADVLAGNGVVQVIDGVVLAGAIRAEVALNALVLDQPVQFSPGSAQLVPGTTAVLDEVARVLNEAPDSLVVEVQGHTDTDGAPETNRSLSQARAEAVATYLEAVGVAPERITAVGLGETRLRVDPEVTPEDKAANRRIEFRVTRVGAQDPTQDAPDEGG